MKRHFHFAAMMAAALGTVAVMGQPAPIFPAATNANEGAHPSAGLVLSGDTLYGTTAGGAGEFWGSGTVFKVNTNGQGFAVLHRFSALSHTSPATNREGAHPTARLLLAGNTLYGTASEGGPAGNGTVFKVHTDGTGFAVLHSFTAGSHGRPINRDGARPRAGLVRSGNTLYGTAERGGNNEGTVFKLNTDGTGFATLHTFTPVSGRNFTNQDGAYPQAALTLSGNQLFGTAWSGGDAAHGTVFKLNTDGTGFAVVHSFAAGPGNDMGRTSNGEGADPEAGVLVEGNTLYGAAHAGGPDGNGTVYKVNTDGTGFSVLHSFMAPGKVGPGMANYDGMSPKGLLQSGNLLFGTAAERGAATQGTVFRLDTEGAGFFPLHHFAGSDGSNPQGDLVLSGNTLYGTANTGGRGGGGTVYKVNTDGTGFMVLHSFMAQPLPAGLTD